MELKFSHFLFHSEFIFFPNGQILQHKKKKMKINKQELIIFKINKFVIESVGCDLFQVNINFFLFILDKRAKRDNMGTFQDEIYLFSFIFVLSI
jgi:hypothetical protein